MERTLVAAWLPSPGSSVGLCACNPQAMSLENGLGYLGGGRQESMELVSFLIDGSFPFLTGAGGQDGVRN